MTMKLFTLEKLEEPRSKGCQNIRTEPSSAIAVHTTTTLHGIKLKNKRIKEALHSKAKEGIQAETFKHLLCS